MHEILSGTMLFVGGMFVAQCYQSYLDRKNAVEEQVEDDPLYAYVVHMYGDRFSFTHECFGTQVTGNSHYIWIKDVNGGTGYLAPKDVVSYVERKSIKDYGDRTKADYSR